MGSHEKGNLQGLSGSWHVAGHPVNTCNFRSVRTSTTRQHQQQPLCSRHAFIVCISSELSSTMILPLLTWRDFDQIGAAILRMSRSIISRSESSPPVHVKPQRRTLQAFTNSFRACPTVIYWESCNFTMLSAQQGARSQPLSLHIL